MKNLEEFAKLNNLSPEEFKTEIYLTAATLGAMEIEEFEEEKKEEANTMSIRFHDESGDIILSVKKLKPETKFTA